MYGLDGVSSGGGGGGGGAGGGGFGAGGRLTLDRVGFQNLQSVVLDLARVRESDSVTVTSQLSAWIKAAAARDGDERRQHNHHSSGYDRSATAMAGGGV